jgi:DNA polymerase
MDATLGEMVAGGEDLLCDLLPVSADGFVLPNGMKLKYNALRPTNDGYEYISDARVFRKFIACKFTDDDPNELAWTKIYGGKVVENVVQALARIVVAEQMVAMGQAGLPVLLQVHDENVTVSVTEQADAVKQVVTRIMSAPPAWAPTLPVACEVGVGPSYGEAK